MIVRKIAVFLMLASFSFMAGAAEKAEKETKAKAETVKKAEATKKVETEKPAPAKSRVLGWSKADKACKIRGGRYLCSRACNKGETGPSGKACKTKEDTGTKETFCDCGTKASGPSGVVNKAPQKQ